jgi:hypothetical protein
MLPRRTTPSIYCFWLLRISLFFACTAQSNYLSRTASAHRSLGPANPSTPQLCGAMSRPSALLLPAFFVFVDNPLALRNLEGPVVIHSAVSHCTDAVCSLSSYRQGLSRCTADWLHQRRDQYELLRFHSTRYILRIFAAALVPSYLIDRVQSSLYIISLCAFRTMTATSDSAVRSRCVHCPVYFFLA